MCYTCQKEKWKEGHQRTLARSQAVFMACVTMFQALGWAPGTLMAKGDMISAFLEITFQCGRTHCHLSTHVYYIRFLSVFFQYTQTVSLVSHCPFSSFIHHRCSCQVLSVYVQQTFDHPSSECQALGQSLVSHSFCVIKNTFQWKVKVFFFSSFKELHDGICVLGSL